MNKQNYLKMIAALNCMQDAFRVIVELHDECDLNRFCDSYPFDKSFDEVGLEEWCQIVAEELQEDVGLYNYTDVTLTALDEMQRLLHSSEESGVPILTVSVDGMSASAKIALVDNIDTLNEALKEMSQSLRDDPI